MRSTRRVSPGSEFAGFRFRPTSSRWPCAGTCGFGLSYRDVEERPTERGVEVDHTTVFRWVRFTPLFSEAARPSRHTPGDRWFIDETYALHSTVPYVNNRVEADHGRLKARLRPMRGLKRDRSLRVVATGHAFVQNLRCGHYELSDRGRRPGSRGDRVHRTRRRHLIDLARQPFPPAPSRTTQQGPQNRHREGHNE